MIDSSCAAWGREHSRLLAVARLARTPMALLARDGLIVYANAAFRALCGDAAECNAGGHFATLAADPVAAHTQLAGRPARLGWSFAAAAADRAAAVVELCFDYPDGDGDGPTVVVLASPCHDADGRPRQRDMDAFGRLGSAWLESEQRFEALFEQGPDAIVLTSCELDNHIVVANPAYCALSGYERAELLGKKTSTLAVWPCSEQRQAVMAALMRGEPVRDLECALRRKDGIVVPTSLSGHRVTIGGAPQLLIIRRDLSERARMLQRLRDSEQRWQFAVEGHGDALWDWDVAADTVYCSAHWWRDIIGAPDAPVRFGVREWERELLREDLEAARARIRPLLKGLVPEARGEVRMRRADGELIWVAYRARVMRRDATGRALRVIGTLRDVTDNKLRQRALDEQRAQLAHHGRLLMLGEMTSATAHELNQPLTAIANYAGACARLLENAPKARTLVRNIEVQALRAGKLISHMTGFAKRREPIYEAVNVAGLVADLYEWLRCDTRVHDIKLESRIAAGLPDVLADRLQIEQVLLNLVWNGIQAMDDVRRSKVITIRADPNCACAVRISVADRGRGVPEQIGTDVFKPFYTTRSDGLGLGLSISRSIVSAHGGRLWSAARAGGGTVFSLSLPRADGAAGACVA